MIKMSELSKIPLVLNLNRVERLYTGGMLLDRWQGLPTERDSSLSEEFIVSTVEYKGPGKPANKGISQVILPDGSLGDLYSIINSDRKAFLGENYADITNHQSGVLCRVGDSNVRLVLQCHPNVTKAKKHLNYYSGKTEAWYIADTRVIDGVAPHIYCGFKKGITREMWKELFYQQDIHKMLDCLHKIEVQKGEVYVIEAGMPHAMGSGSLFIEVHEPCDYTIRVERNYSTRTLSDEEMHYGLGFDIMLDFFDYTTYDQNEIIEKCKSEPMILKENDDAVVARYVPYEMTDRFIVDKVSVKKQFTFEKYDGHYLLITLKGESILSCHNQKFVVPQGRGIFVPANVENLTVNNDCDLIVAYPFKI